MPAPHLPARSQVNPDSRGSGAAQPFSDLETVTNQTPKGPAARIQANRCTSSGGRSLNASAPLYALLSAGARPAAGRVAVSVQQHRASPVMDAIELLAKYTDVSADQKHFAEVEKVPPHPRLPRHGGFPFDHRARLLDSGPDLIGSAIRNPGGAHPVSNPLVRPGVASQSCGPRCSIRTSGPRQNPGI